MQLPSVFNKLEIDGDDPVPVLFRHRLDRPRADNARVVDEDVYPAEGLQNLIDTATV